MGMTACYNFGVGILALAMWVLGAEFSTSDVNELLSEGSSCALMSESYKV